MRFTRPGNAVASPFRFETPGPDPAEWEYGEPEAFGSSADGRAADEEDDAAWSEGDEHEDPAGNFDEAVVSAPAEDPGQVAGGVGLGEEDAHEETYPTDEALDEDDEAAGFGRGGTDPYAVREWEETTGPRQPPHETAHGTAFADAPLVEPYSVEPDPTDAALGRLAEQVASREAPPSAGEAARGTRWTRCFSTAHLTPVMQEYTDNAAAAAKNGRDRASCIVMLNAALGRLLPLRRKRWPARAGSTRRVLMADLSIHTIERAMEQLTALGFARRLLTIDFLDSRGRQAGTTRPERLKASVLAALLAQSPRRGCHYVFALSIMHAKHSVLLTVDNTGSRPVVKWFDQFSPRAVDDATTTLDARITDATMRYWDAARRLRKIGSRTHVQIWAIRRPVRA